MDKTELVKKVYENLASTFTDQLRAIEALTGIGANFGWKYDDAGRKVFILLDAGPITRPSDEHVAWAKEEVPKIITKAEKDAGISGSNEAKD